MGQFFGGRSVSTMGVAGVGIAPEARGRGAGSAMMTAMLREAKAQSFALSTLYAATLSLYRKVGYERAGAHYDMSFDPRTDVGVLRAPKDTRVHEVKSLDGDLRALYTSVARRAPGHLDRGPYIWSGIVNPRGKEAKIFAITHDERPEGYVVVAHTRSDGPTTVTVTDLVATTRRAALTILRLLVEYRSLATSVKWSGSPDDLIATQLPECHVQTSLPDSWMLRVVDVERALSQRGYPKLDAELWFELEDSSLPENSGEYRLCLREGAPTVTRERAPQTARRVRLNERGLASLFSGYGPPHILAAAELIDADEGTQEELTRCFGSRPPVLPDFF